MLFKCPRGLLPAGRELERETAEVTGCAGKEAVTDEETKRWQQHR